MSKKSDIMEQRNNTVLGRLEVVRMDVNSIMPNAYNPNRQSEHEFELLCRSIEEDGFCVERGTPVLCADLIWRSAGELEVGQKIIAFDEDKQPGNKKHLRKFLTAEITSNRLFEDEVYEVKVESGEGVKCNGEHPWLVYREIGPMQERLYGDWCKTSDLREGDQVYKIVEPWEVETSYDAGWLAGFLDGEGRSISGGESSVKRTVTSVTKIGRGMLAGISTSSKTYIANGFAVHNTQPCVVRKSDNVIVDGEHRWRAAQSIGMKTIPVVLTEMSDAQMKMSTLRHNRARGEEDMALAAAVLKDLAASGSLDSAKDSLMLDDSEISKLLNDIDLPEQLAGEEFKEQFDILKDSNGNPVSRETVYQGSEAAADAVRKQEQLIKQAKSDQEKTQIAKELSSIFRFNFSFYGKEAQEISKILGNHPADRILQLCRMEAEV